MVNDHNGYMSPTPTDVFTGLIIFLSINFLVAAMYFGVLNP